MNIRRIPIVFLVAGLALKTSLVLLWRYRKFPGLLNLLIYYDPGARYFAERLTRLFFDYGGITFAPGSNTFFDIFLVVGFGIECLLAGFLFRWLSGRFVNQPGAEGLTGTRTKPNLKPSH
jgi:hypothetical protein